MKRKGKKFSVKTQAEFGEIMHTKIKIDLSMKETNSKPKNLLQKCFVISQRGVFMKTSEFVTFSIKISDYNLIKKCSKRN